MILYHTSTIEIHKPDLLHSRPRLDFGNGFYLTPHEKQAERYGERFIKSGKVAILNTFKLDGKRKDCTHKIFTAYDEEWLDFVIACRKGLPHENYDIIEGSIVDNRIFDTIDLYFSGIYTKDQVLGQLQYADFNRQVCITSQYVLDKYLHFQASKRILNMQANFAVLQKKYVRIVKIFAEQASLTYEDALGKFYDSKTYDLISNGVADMHCFSDEYLADELLIEFGYKQSPK